VYTAIVAMDLAVALSFTVYAAVLLGMSLRFIAVAAVVLLFTSPSVMWHRRLND
jgi:hypothetical protein